MMTSPIWSDARGARDGFTDHHGAQLGGRGLGQRTAKLAHRRAGGETITMSSMESPFSVNLFCPAGITSALRAKPNILASGPFA